MADALIDGNVRVSWVASIATQSAPTTTELNAGLLLQSYLTPDGLNGFQSDTTKSDTSSLASIVNTENLGREAYSGLLLRFKKQTSSDTPYTTLAYAVSGYVVIRYDVAETTAWASSQAIDVFQVRCMRHRPLAPEQSSVRKYEVPLALLAAPSLDAAVA